MSKFAAEVLISTDSELPPAGASVDVVVIDVIRAFTTASILFAQGVTEVICARDHADAVGLGADVVIVGEVETGTSPVGVIANSPVEVGQHNFRGRRVAFFSLNGTRVLYRAPAGGVLMAAAAANVRATAHWLLSRASTRRIHIVVSDPDGPEDHACAQHLAKLLRGMPVNSAATSRDIDEARHAHWARWGSTVTPEQWRVFEADVDVCARLDSYAFPMFVDVDSEGRPTIRPHLPKEVEQG